MAAVRRAASAASASPAECKEEEVYVSAQDALRRWQPPWPTPTNRSSAKRQPAPGSSRPPPPATLSCPCTLYDGVSIPFVFRDLVVAYAHGCAFCLPLRLGGTSADT